MRQPLGVLRVRKAEREAPPPKRDTPPLEEAQVQLQQCVEKRRGQVAEVEVEQVLEEMLRGEEEAEGGVSRSSEEGQKPEGRRQHIIEWGGARDEGKSGMLVLPERESESERASERARPRERESRFEWMDADFFEAFQPETHRGTALSY